MSRPQNQRRRVVSAPRADAAPPYPIKTEPPRPSVAPLPAAESAAKPAVQPEPKTSAAYSTSCIDQMPLAMAYVPDQVWRKVYSPGKALERGTIFEELDLPFMRGAK